MAEKVSEKKLDFIFTPDGFIPDIDMTQENKKTSWL